MTNPTHSAHSKQEETTKPVSHSNVSAQATPQTETKKNAAPSSTSTSTSTPAPTTAHTPAHVPVPATPAKETKKESKKEGKETTTKTKTSPAVAATSKPAKKKGTKAKWVKKEKVKKDQKIKDAGEILKKNWKPVFWGRFGKKNMRKRTNPKFDKWRRPRGIDILFRKDDGAMPHSGYRTPNAIRGLHPSGYTEVLVYSKKDLEKIKPATHAIRFSGTIGRKKRIELTHYANTKKIHILN